MKPWIRHARTWAVLGGHLRRLAVTFLVLEALYLVAGNLFLTFGLARVASFAPENLEMEVEGVITLWPGTAHVRRYRMRGQDRAIQWWLEVDDAEVTVDLLDLLHRKFHATRVRARDCAFHLRRKLDDDGARRPRAAALVPIPGFADPPMLPIGPPKAPVTDADYRLWTVQLDDVVAGAREIWIDEWRLLGPAEVRGGFFLKPARTVEVGPATLDVRAGELRIAERPTLRALEVHLATTVGVIDLRGPLASAVRRISVSGSVDAEVPDVSFLRLYLARDFPAKLDEGAGAVHVGLRLVNGFALPPTAIRVESERLVIRSARLDAVLSFTGAARVLGSASGPTASGELRVRDASVIRPGSVVEAPVLDAVARFRGLPRDLAEPLVIEHTHLDVSAIVPALGVLLPPREEGEAAPVGLEGRASLRAEADIDRSLRGAGRIEARSERVRLATSALDAAGAISAKLVFDGVDLRQGHLHLLPSDVAVDDLTITREGRAHRGGRLRVDVAQGSLHSGQPRDVVLTVAASFADLRWLAFHDGEGNRAEATGGAASATLVVRRPAALFDGSPEDAAITGSLSVSASGDGRFRDLAIRGNVAARAVVEGLDLGRRTLRLSGTHVVARDLEIGRGKDRSSGWWGSFDLAPFQASAAGPVALEAHVGVRCQSGEPFLAALASAGTIPGWVGSVFPMTDLRASADVSRRRGVIDLRLAVASSSAQIQAALHDVGGAMDGAVHVDTALLSLGVALAHGESHLQVFAGEGWLKSQIAALDARSAAPPGSATRPAAR